MYKDHPGMMKGDGYTFWKDIIEVPLAAISFLSIAASVFDFMRWGSPCFIFLSSFLIFETVCAFLMTQCFFEGIFFGFVLFFRALARMLGFSTGFLFLYL